MSYLNVTTFIIFNLQDFTVEVKSTTLKRFPSRVSEYPIEELPNLSGD